MKFLTTSSLSTEIQGILHGDDIPITGIFNFLQNANKGDVVIRHWIDEKGVQIASEKGVSCIITQDPQGEAFDVAIKMNVPLIVTKKIEYANAFAIKWSLENFAPKNFRIVITGTNGKSTTTHMIYKILKRAGLKCYTNTDSLSEFNTLIDPMVAKQIAELPEDIEAIILEISEVQGWEDRIMEDHAYLMTRAINPNVVVLTNVAVDHIGLVNSLEDAYHEISGALKDFNGQMVVLNSEDPLIMKMRDLIPPEAEVLLFGEGGQVESRDQGIFLYGEKILSKDELPFQSPHFIQNTTAAIAAATTMDIDTETIVNAVKHYEPLKRRFNILHKNPLIIDDFAHNPDGINATVKSAAELSEGLLHVVCAIRGSRGEPINRENAISVAKSLKNLDYSLILSSSDDVVDHNNFVKPEEKKVFIDELQKKGIIYIHCQNLSQALKKAIEKAGKNDVILLIGAQGMDPASDVLKKLGYI